jgi:L-threonylcarbamoyladenylate synthase
MPGPLTILLHKKSNVPDMVTAGSDFVGIRIPQNQVARELLIEVNLPIAAPSANVSTKPSPTSAAMVFDNFGNKVPMIIDGGDCEVGIESTVVKVEDDRVIITRP